MAQVELRLATIENVRFQGATRRKGGGPPIKVTARLQVYVATAREVAAIEDLQGEKLFARISTQELAWDTGEAPAPGSVSVQKVPPCDNCGLTVRCECSDAERGAGATDTEPPGAAPAQSPPPEEQLPTATEAADLAPPDLGHCHSMAHVDADKAPAAVWAGTVGDNAEFGMCADCQAAEETTPGYVDTLDGMAEVRTLLPPDDEITNDQVVALAVEFSKPAFVITTCLYRTLSAGIEAEQALDLIGSAAGNKDLADMELPAAVAMLVEGINNPPAAEGEPGDAASLEDQAKEVAAIRAEIRGGDATAIPVCSNTEAHPDEPGLAVRADMEGTALCQACYDLTASADNKIFCAPCGTRMATEDIAGGKACAGCGMMLVEPDDMPDSAA